MPGSEVYVTHDWSRYVGHPLNGEPPPVCGRVTTGPDGVALEKCLCVLRWDGEGYYCPACDGETRP